MIMRDHKNRAMPPARGSEWPLVRSWVFLTAILLVQALCAFFFVSDIILGILGIYVSPLSWQQREYLEIGAAIGLLLGLFLGGVAIYRTTRDRRIAEQDGTRCAQRRFEMGEVERSIEDMERPLAHLEVLHVGAHRRIGVVPDHECP